MEKRVKVYGILITIVYCFLVITSISENFSLAKTAYDEGSKKTTAKCTSELFHFRTSPSDIGYSFSQSGINTLTGEEVGIEIRECVVKVPKSMTATTTTEKTFEVVKFILAIFLFLLILYIPFLFFMIVKPMWQNNILNLKLMKRIKRMGWVLISIYLLQWLFSIGDWYSISQRIELENYQINFNNASGELLILGLVTLMLGEVLNHTLKMKEDQDLTI